ncbi:MAG: glycosyltransferase family 39 protein [Planctomycetes bacterium]|nr:glycosyltransferase family 39 protein [Planctomycetota bacterium]
MTEVFAGRRFWLAVVVVVVLAVGLRLAGLGRWPFASDELGTFNEVALFHNPPNPITHPDQAVPRVIPLSMLVLDAGYRLFGRNEFGCRLLISLLGVAHVAVVTVGLSRVAPRAVALTAGVWLAVAVEHIFYSQYHRFYTLAALLVASATLAAARSVRTGSGRWMTAACVLAGLAVLAHTLAGAVFGVLLIGGAVSAVAGRWKPALVATVGAVAAAGGFALVILPVIGAKAGLTSWTGLSSLHAALGAIVQVSWPVCVLAVPGAVVLWRQDREQGAFWIGAAGVWAGMAAVLPAVLPYHSAYIFPFALPMFVLAATAVVEAATAVRERAGPTAGWLVWVGLPLLNLPALASYYQDGNRHDLRTAAAYVAERIGPADRVISNEPDKLAHYRPALVPHLVHVPRAASPQDAVGAVPPGGRLWVVCSGGRGGFEPEWQEWVHQHCHLQTTVSRTRYDYYAFSVWVFRTPPLSP